MWSEFVPETARGLLDRWPLSMIALVSCLFLPGPLIIFIAQPQLFAAWSGAILILMSLAITFPVLMLSSLTIATGLSVFQQITHTTDQDWTSEHQWKLVIGAGNLTNLCLYTVAAVAYHHQIRLGATLLLVCALLLGFTLVLWLAGGVLVMLAERRKAARAVPKPIVR